MPSLAVRSQAPSLKEALRIIPMQIAFFGLGRMGAAMARNLLEAGHRVTVFNRTRRKAEALANHGASVAHSVAEACRGAELCWTMLADDRAVNDLVLAPEGIADHMERGAVHVSSSTISVAVSRHLSQTHGERGQDYLSVPVFGRPDAAEAKRLIAVAGGAPDVLEKLRPAIEAVSRAIFVAGPQPWQANLFKLCGNFTLASMVETLGEAFATVRKSGADERAFFEVISELYGSPVYKNYGSIILDERYDPPAFVLRLGLKDLRLVLEAAGEFESPMPAASLIRDQYLNALAHGQENLDWSSLARVSARNAGLTD